MYLCRGCGQNKVTLEERCPNCGLLDLIDTTPFLIQALRDILEEAYNGLKWYRDMHPEHDSPVDDELYKRIEVALGFPQ